MSGDGLLDRFLIFSICPTMNTSATVREYFELLKESPLKSFQDIFMKIYDDHKEDEKKYILSEGAQRLFDQMADNYAEYINEKYSVEDDIIEGTSTAIFIWIFYLFIYIKMDIAYIYFICFIEMLYMAIYICFLFKT